MTFLYREARGGGKNTMSKQVGRSATKRPLETTTTMSQLSAPKRVQHNIRPIGASPQQQKDVRGAPSRVLCIKTDLEESVLIEFLQSIGGAPLDALHVKPKNMSFVEFRSIAE